MSRIHEALKRAEQERAQSGRAMAATWTDTPVDPSPGLSLGADAVSPATQPIAEGLLNMMPTAWTPDPRTMLFFGDTERKYGAEEFRTLRSRLYQLRERQVLKKILITSSLPKEGKSFVAANLAQVLVQQHGRRALLIDADLRAPGLHSVLGTKDSPGLSDYLSGTADELAILQRGPMENLFFIPAGTMASNPAELVTNGKLRGLLTRFEPVFDWIIVDSPPVVPVSDASLMAGWCDGVLLVARSHVTPADLARKARLEFSEKQLLGVVLNAVEVDSSEYYSRYYYKAAAGEPKGQTKQS
jgi:capsular exopolysaccharide synthesis family protein